MLEAVIFDLDGVLIDSVASSYRVKSKILSEDYGIDITRVPDPHNEGHKGGSLRTLLTAVKASHDRDINEAEFTKKIIDSVYEDLKENNVSVDPSLLRFLHDLKDHRVPLGVATSALGQSARNKLSILGITDFFAAVVTADVILRHKPHPEAYLATLDQLKVAPTKSIAFEDSAAGAASALAAGLTVIGCTMFTANKEPLPGAALTIDNWNEINYKRLVQTLTLR